MREVAEVLRALQRSDFRRSKELSAKDAQYLTDKGLETVLTHARDLIEKRLAPAQPANDGKQTPWRGHPVFVAQHATATCCRSCLEKWHGIPTGVDLTPDQTNYVVDVIAAWLTKASGLIEKN
jgi:hypothetical protein